MKKGEFVTVQYENRSIPAVILLASSNQKSLMLGFEGILGGHVGQMPVLMDPSGEYRSLVTNESVLIFVSAEPPDEPPEAA